MAIKIENLFANALLELLNEKKLEKITINHLLEATGASRQTFYNHFQDKNDLIQWIYMNYVILDFHGTNHDIQYCQHLLGYYTRVKKYGDFMKQAIAYQGQNSLREHMKYYLSAWDQEYYAKLFKNKFKKDPPEAFSFFVEYHSQGTVGMILKWIETDFPLPPEEIFRYAITPRSHILDYWDIIDEAPNFYLKSDDSEFPLV